MNEMLQAVVRPAAELSVLPAAEAGMLSTLQQNLLAESCNPGAAAEYQAAADPAEGRTE